MLRCCGLFLGHLRHIFTSSGGARFLCVRVFSSFSALHQVSSTGKLTLADVIGRGCLRLSRCWPAFAFLLGRPSIRGYSAYGLVHCLPRRCSLRLLLFCTLWHVRPYTCVQGRCGQCLLGFGVMSAFFFSYIHMLTTCAWPGGARSGEPCWPARPRSTSLVSLSMHGVFKNHACVHGQGLSARRTCHAVLCDYD